MKKLLLTLSACTTCLISGIAQQVPNSSFESWGSYTYEDPASAWFTANALSTAVARTVTVIRVQGYNSNSAVRLEVKTSGADTLPAYIGNEIAGFDDFSGGRPYVGATPTGISGFIRYNLQADDTAFLFVAFKQNGAVVGAGTFPLAHSSSQANFIAFNFPMTVSATRDSVLLLCVINNIPAGGAMPKPGSWLELDSLSFETAGGPVLAEEGSFENWSVRNIHEPTGWRNGSRLHSLPTGLVTQTQDAYSGTYAASLTSVYAPSLRQVIPGMIEVIIPAPSLTVDSTDSLTFYYKASTAIPGIEGGYLQISSLDADSNSRSSGMMKIDTSSTFRKVTIPFSVLFEPDTRFLSIMFWSSSSILSTIAGNNLIIDDVTITRTPVGIKDAQKSARKIYPNPAQDVVYIEQANGFDYRVVDMAGKTLLHGTIEGGQINIKQLIPGNYLLQIQDKAGNSQTSLIEKQ